MSQSDLSSRDYHLSKLSDFQRLVFLICKVEMIALNTNPCGAGYELPGRAQCREQMRKGGKIGAGETSSKAVVI